MMAILLPAHTSAQIPIDPPKIRSGPCPGFEKGMAHPRDIGNFYALRAVEIIRAAKSRDITKLHQLVSPTADFSVWHGDYGTSAKQGVPGIMQIARHIDARRFQVSIKEAGPFAVSEGVCAQELPILFRGKDKARGIALTFRFKDGILTGAHGNGVNLIEGDIPQD